MDISEVRYSYRVGIRVEVKGPTNTHGTRLRVHRSDENYNGDPDRLTVSWDHSLSGSDNAVEAVKAYLDRKKDDWGGTWVLAGADGAGWLAVMVPPES